MSSPRWAAVARLSDGVVLAQAAQPTPLDAGAQATVARVLASGQIKPDTQLTVTIGEEHGHLHLSAGASCVFLLLAPQDYPRRAALRLLAELSGWAAQRLDADAVEAAAGEGALQAECKLYLKGCLQRYAGGGGSGGIGNSGKSNGAGNSNSDSSRLAEVSVQIEEVKSTMANNIDQVMSNAESLRGVEDKSEAMLEDAATYRTRATAVKRTLFLRMWKLRIIVALVVLSIVGYIVIPLVT